MKKEFKRERRKISSTVLYGILGSIILFALILVLLLKFSPLDRIYLYLIAGLAALSISYPLTIKPIRTSLLNLYSSAEKISSALENLSRGNLKELEFNLSRLQELGEKASLLTQEQREKIIAVLHTLKNAQENLQAHQVEKAKEIVSSLISNLEQDFKL